MNRKFTKENGRKAKLNTMINWKEHKKLRISNSDKSMFKHEIVKLSCLMIALNKFNISEIYTEHKIGNRKADVYFKTDRLEEYAIEVQKNLSNNYQFKAEVFYLNKDITPIIIKLNEVPDDIDKIWDFVNSKL